MNSDSIIPLVLALLCVSAVGVSSSTLTSSMSTDPEDVINPDYERLPLSQDDAERLREEVTSNGEQMSAKAGETGNEKQVESPPQDAESQPDQQQSDSGDGESQQSNQQSEKQSGEKVVPPSLLDKLLAFLWNVLPILALLAVLGALAVLAHRYSDRLLALVAALLPERRAGSASDDGSDGRPWPTVEPDNEVHGAWLTMVSRLDIDQPRTKTASECARAAVDAGMDPDAVGTLTRLFEEVRYGGAPVTESRRTQAKSGLKRLGIESGTPL